MDQRYWYFEDEPKVKFEFAKPSVSGLPSAIDIAGAHVVTCNRLSPRTKAVNEYSNFVRYVMRSGTNIDDALSPEISPERNFGPAVKEKRSHSNDYSPHSVQQIFKSSVPVGESTPENSSRLFGPPFCKENVSPLNCLELSPPTQIAGCELTLEQRRDLDKLLLEHNEVFEESTFATPFATHSIDTREHLPISSPPYRLPPQRKTFLRQEINEMLRTGVIVECESPWAAPVVIVPKKTGDLRICID
ncbi:uncharacterized protein LOC118756586 [Rhagoletis pomonella]|uniref:uncharacterized protein LOC118756586 n=1 Tax=Rhagoletis pomonella TaxID=28610 RepID=UPI001784B6ED|nr:uncharacterized protein LOC118756586 [Rhagoletis pomonella]